MPVEINITDSDELAKKIKKDMTVKIKGGKLPTPKIPSVSDFIKKD